MTGHGRETSDVIASEALALSRFLERNPMPTDETKLEEWEFLPDGPSRDGSTPYWDFLHDLTVSTLGMSYRDAVRVDPATAHEILVEVARHRWPHLRTGTGRP